jgi:hypothetical protein
MQETRRVFGGPALEKRKVPGVGGYGGVEVWRGSVRTACLVPACVIADHCGLPPAAARATRPDHGERPMQASSEIAKLKREIATLRDIVGQSRPGSKNAMSVAERRTLKSEIDRCILELDELRGKLAQ